MEPRIICHLFLLLFFISVASSQSVIKATASGNTTTLILPKDETLVIAMKPIKEISDINYTLSVDQEVIHNGTCNSCYDRTHWQPLLIITKEFLRRLYDETDFPIPAKVRLLGGRTLTLSSRNKVFWQLFSLPLIEDAMGVINKSQEEFVNLPERDPVFVAVWNRHESGIQVDLRLHDGEEVTSKTKSITAEKGWSIICLYEHFLEDLNSYFPTDKKGRRLGMFVYEDIRYQIFSLPLKPEGKKSLGSTLIIIMAVLVTSVVLFALYSGYWFFLRKRNEAKLEGKTAINLNYPINTSEGTSSREHSEAIPRPYVARPNSCHDSENSLYGAVLFH